MSHQLEIAYGAYRRNKVIIEIKDDGALKIADILAQAKDHADVQGKEDEALVQALLTSALPPDYILSLSRLNDKGEFSDGEHGEAAYLKYNPTKVTPRTQWNDGNLNVNNQLSVVEEKHYNDGKLNDSRKGIAAVQTFSASTGKLTVKQHYKEDLLNDAPDGEAAWQRWDESGELNYKAYQKDGKYNESANGEPACWKKESGLIHVWHCVDDKDQDLPDGTPAYQKFALNGELLLVMHSRGGEHIHPSDGTPGKLKFEGGKLTAAWHHANDPKPLNRWELRKLAKKPAIQALKKLRP